MRCVVLGGNGFIGRSLVGRLLSAGYQVRVFDRPTPSVLAEDRPDGVEWIEGDFLNHHDIEAAVSGCDVVFHLISTTIPKTSNDDPVYDVETNLIASINMLDASVKCGVRKIIFTSSGGTVYGVPKRVPVPESHPTDPICSYGITKLAIEKYLHLYRVHHGLNYQILRVSNPYGEGQKIQSMQGAVGVFIGKALREEVIEIWGDGSVVRDYIHVSDVSAALEAAIKYEGNERVMNIGSGCGKSLNEILDELEKVLGRQVQRHYNKARSIDVPTSILDSSLAGHELGWSPQISFSEGMKATIGYYRALME